MKDQSTVREHLIDQLEANNAHIGFEQAVDGLIWNATGEKPENHPYSIWELVEHLRIAQKDIVEFSQNPDYEALQWPDDYWPEMQAPDSKDQWDQSLQQIREDRDHMVELIRNPANDLFEVFTWGNGQTLFREAVLIIDHNAYHIGQIVLIRRILGSWD